MTRGSISTSIARVFFLTAALITAGIAERGFAQGAPSAPGALSASASNCSQVSLTWQAAVDNSGTGLKSYTIWRSDNSNPLVVIAASRTWFADTLLVPSATTLNYYVVAQDNAGNNSVPSGTVAVTTPACEMAAGEVAIDNAATEPLGRSMAVYGTEQAILYLKWNSNYTSKDTWIHVSDPSTGQNSHFMLHPQMGYQYETNYILTSATDLWTFSTNTGASGNLLLNHYRLSGTTYSGATLLSSQSVGDTYSWGESLIQLKSGGIVAVWNEWSPGRYTGNLAIGVAYVSPTGVLNSHFPITLGTPGNTKSRIAVAQHPADGSVWLFDKVDSVSSIFALHFTEGQNDLILDWTNAAFITQANNSPNGPDGEFPQLSAIADPTRNEILLAYQNQQSQAVYIDPLYMYGANLLFLRRAPISIAQIDSTGATGFISFPNYTERLLQFGLSVLPDGNIWLTYQPVESTGYTWNEVYTSEYSNGSWSAPTAVGYNFANYNNASGLGFDPGAMVQRSDQATVAFVAPDQQLHTFDLANLTPVTTSVPSTQVTNPVAGSTLSGTVGISVSASSTVGISRVELWLDNALAGTSTSAPYNFSWVTSASANGSHTLMSKAYDSNGDVGSSSPISVSVSNVASSNLVVNILNPSNGGMVSRGQKLTISAAATDSVTVTKVQFYVDGSLLGTAMKSPYAYSWKVPNKKGLHTIKAQAFDSAGNVASQSISVTAQ